MKASTDNWGTGSNCTREIWDLCPPMESILIKKRYMLKDARRRINDHSWPQTEYIGGSWGIIAPGTPGGVDHCSLITYTAYFEREETQ